MSQEKKRIYVVDDDPVVTRVIRMGLESAGYAVESANNGLEFLQRLSEETPDFLITDIEMPEMDGKELCFAIDSEFPDRRFPIVVLTSHTEGHRREWTQDYPNLHLMEKPVSIVRLVAQINECLGRSIEA
jgi:CheY-like chemotaxis protein